MGLEKARKVLWGRSGNRCAVCRRELVIDATLADAESVVGEECHIVSGKLHGPRYDPGFAPQQLDEPDNLLLLCAVHHKMIDDQPETYTADILRRLKANHEKWVSATLASDDLPKPIRIRRVKGGAPTHLDRLTTGQELMKVVAGSLSAEFGHDELETPLEMELVSRFLQTAQEWGDLWDDMEVGRQVEIAYDLSNLLHELDEAGFWAFGGREVRSIEGGVGEPSPWPVAIVRVVRSSNPEIMLGARR